MCEGVVSCLSRVVQAAQQLGIAATIVMSPDAPAFKVEATRRYGATVVMAESTSQARREVAEELARTEGRFLVPPYDNLAVMAGQGTIGLELLEQCIPAAVFVPIGGGGLIGGIAAATLQALSGAHLVVEPAGALGLAAAQAYAGDLPAGSPVVTIASGGNTTLEFLHQLRGGG